MVFSEATPPAAAGTGAVGAAPDGFDAVGVVVAVGSAAGLTDTAVLDVPLPMLDGRCRREVRENVSPRGKRVCNKTPLAHYYKQVGSMRPPPAPPLADVSAHGGHKRQGHTALSQHQFISGIIAAV